jgi:hypothetical protein
LGKGSELGKAAIGVDGWYRGSTDAEDVEAIDADFRIFRGDIAVLSSPTETRSSCFKVVVVEEEEAADGADTSDITLGLSEFEDESLLDSATAGT